MSHVIPDSAFAAMPQLMLLLVAAGAIYYLVVGSDWLVDGAAGLAQRLGIAKVVVGATVVSLGTTSPEAAVSVMAAWQGRAAQPTCLYRVSAAPRNMLLTNMSIKINFDVVILLICFVIPFVFKTLKTHYN